MFRTHGSVKWKVQDQKATFGEGLSALSLSERKCQISKMVRAELLLLETLLSAINTFP